MAIIAFVPFLFVQRIGSGKGWHPVREAVVLVVLYCLIVCLGNLLADIKAEEVNPIWIYIIPLSLGIPFLLTPNKNGDIQDIAEYTQDSLGSLQRLHYFIWPSSSGKPSFLSRFDAETKSGEIGKDINDIEFFLIMVFTFLPALGFAVRISDWVLASLYFSWATIFNWKPLPLPALIFDVNREVVSAPMGFSIGLACGFVWQFARPFARMIISPIFDSSD